MKLFDITLPDPNICKEESLYYRKSSGEIKRIDNRLIIPVGQSVSFDTFFNCFSYQKYIKYTNLHTLGISLSLKGSFEINLFMVNIDKPLERIMLSSNNFDSAARADFAVTQDLCIFLSEGYLYVELKSQKEGSSFYSGEFFAVDCNSQNAKIALVFCTYRREDYLYRNIANITTYLADNPDLKDKFTLIAADNGNTVDREKVLGATVYKNKNLGGSGGFTRGIIEALKDSSNTHFLLMDDDIVFDPKILRKTYSFIALANNITELAVGGAMLDLDKKYYQYEMGGKTTGLKLLNMKNGMDVRKTQSVASNEKEEKINYNAWWYMCMPVSAAVKRGLPLPIFIKGDDVEYGLRFKGDIAVLNGIAVWHESFDKKYSGELEYYIKRNELIIAALHFPSVTVAQLMRKMIRAIGKRLVYQRYYEVDFIIKAYEDFLKGANFLLELDALSLHNELRKRCPPFLGEQDLAEKYNVTFDPRKYNKSITEDYICKSQYLTLNGYLIPKVFYKREDKNSYRIIDVNNPQPINFYKAIKVLHYNTAAQMGFVTRLDKGKLICAGLKIIKIYILMLMHYRKVCRSYRENFEKLCSLEHWKEILEI